MLKENALTKASQIRCSSQKVTDDGVVTFGGNQGVDFLSEHFRGISGDSHRNGVREATRELRNDSPGPSGRRRVLDGKVTS